MAMADLDGIENKIDAYLELKWEECLRYGMTPHPVEFDMYYSV